MATFNGTDGNDVLVGTTGPDIFVGGAGDDIYFVNHSGDTIIEAANEGRDVAYASTSYVLNAGAYVEILSTASLSGTEAISLAGNELDQEVYGNAGANTLSGGGGSDTLVGLGGDDTYFVTDGRERIVESEGAGRDVVYAGTSYALAAGAHVEVLSTAWLAGTDAIDLTGNELINEILGNAGANVLRGGGGADALIGLGGDDVYFVTDGGERIIEAAGGGRDVIYAGTSYALTAGAHVEILSTASLAGMGAINLTGNELENEILGNAGSNVLDGGSGDDVLVGMGGGDTFAFTTALGGGNVDRILDFAVGVDKIGLDDTVFTGCGFGMLSASAFRAGSSAQDADDRIIYDASTGALYFDADGNGAGAAVQFASVTAGLGLNASDFLVSNSSAGAWDY